MNCFEQFIRCEWFGYKHLCSQFESIGNRLWCRITTHDYDRYLWPLCFDFSHEIHAISSRHLHIYKEECIGIIF